MEKSKPHHDLKAIKRLTVAGSITVVRAALNDALILGLAFSDIVNTIISLKRKDFYKSMTAYQDHTCWHDVYRPETEAGKLYIKLILQDNVIVVSFKEK
ncbi:type II toxin-antitoxin system MqsR family toxin [Desulfovibrio sp. OttesenSCG-928-F20]|nr:type II toxin-antitoxin system MqsR family toxin [Desulfovibrio sp. OttesenSCG-928-F20]